MTNNTPPSRAHTPANNALFDAAEAGDLAGIVWALENGAGKNARNDKDETALHIAARGNYASIVGHLISIGAALDPQNADGDTPLHVAIYYDRQDMSVLLLDAGTDSSILNNTGQSAFEYAIAFDNLRAFEKMKWPETVDKGAMLLCASLYDSPKTAAALLDKGADINARYAEGRTPLIVAVSGGHEGMTRLLLDRKALIGLRDDKGLTALDYARGHNPPTLVSLIEAAAKSIRDEAARSAHRGITEPLSVPVKIILKKRPGHGHP